MSFAAIVEAALPALLALGVAAQSLAAGDIRETATSLTASTGDGLRLELDRVSGCLSSLRIGGSTYTLSSQPLIRFEEVLEKKGAPDLLDGGLTGDWTKYASSGKNSRIVQLDQKEPTPLVLSGWCRYETKAGASGWMNRNLALNACGIYADGDAMPEQSAYFGQYDHGPQFNSRVICPDQPLKQVEVRRTADDPNSVAWFKGITLREARHRTVSPHSPCGRIDCTITQEFRIKDAGISGVVKYQPADDRIVIRCRFASETKTDRAISAYLAIPFDANGGTWHDDLRNSRKIEPGKMYRRDDYWYGAGRDGYNDRYPLACVENRDGAGLAIATELAEPRVFRTEYDGARKELRIRYDIGLSPDGGRWENQGSFTVYLFTYNGADGFRGAADRFQRIFDWAFMKRAKHEGMWIPFVSPETIPGGWEDFHVTFVEAVSNVGWERARRMYSLRYVEPWIHHQTMIPEKVASAVSGAPDPSVSIKLPDRLRGDKSPDLFEDVSARFAAYPGSYITDNWGQPQGYFFRQPERKENMMIVNPNPDLPAPPGSSFSSGGYDWQGILESAQSPSQWHIDGWTVTKATDAPVAIIDSDEKAGGERSVRIDPVVSKSCWGTWTRGINQVFYYKGSSRGPFEMCFSVRGEGMPARGTSIGWTITFYYEDGSSEVRRVGLEGLNEKWTRIAKSLDVKAKPYAINLYFGKDSRDIDPSAVWLNDVELKASGERENLLVNPGFEHAELLPGGIGGIYLDTMECYANNLNYRRDHWQFAEEPLTFDSARKPALQQQFSHVTFGRRAAEWARARDKIAFANCAPVTPFAAPYMDAMGSEEFWAPDGKWNPKSDREFQFVRFMSGAKSWSILQYSDLTADQIRRYVNRCAFYGVYPSWIYKWTNPVFIAQIRPLYAKMMPILVEINTAGWRPLTMASSDSAHIWMERFGDDKSVYLTVFNTAAVEQSSIITLDPRLKLTGRRIVELTSGAQVDLNSDGASFSVHLSSEDLKIFRLKP